VAWVGHSIYFEKPKGFNSVLGGFFAELTG
jgi:hypothetical protein